MFYATIEHVYQLKPHRWVNTLDSNNVADRIITAVKRNERFTLIPWYFNIMLAVKWFVAIGKLSQLVINLSFF